MTTQVYGTIALPDNVDITDPSYDEDVWCRINNFPISAGTYECYTITADDDETGGWGERIARIGIRKAKADHFERKGMIGVDCGMAGFFNCDNRVPFTELAVGNSDPVYLTENAFFSDSGFGDGGYDVYAGYHDGEITEVYIEFIGEEK